VAHENKLQNSVIEQEAAGIDTSGRSPDILLRDLDEAIMALDFPRATALANAYLQSGADRKAYQSIVALAACRFQDDPHNQKITISTFEEYAHNSTHLRDRLLLAAARLLVGWSRCRASAIAMPVSRRTGSTTEPSGAMEEEGHGACL
jgi:hypothetical protein